MSKIDFSYASKSEHNFAQRLVIKTIETLTGNGVNANIAEGIYCERPKLISENSKFLICKVTFKYLLWSGNAVHSIKGPLTKKGEISVKISIKKIFLFILYLTHKNDIIIIVVNKLIIL